MNDYRKKLYPKYVSKHLFHLHGGKSFEKIKKQFPIWDKYYARHFPMNKSIEILEIGCGDGEFLCYLKEKGYKNYFGIDISEEQIKMARDLGIENVKVADLRDFLRNKNQAYDVIIARDVLEHFKKDEILDILEILFHALQSRGKFILQSPNGEGLFGTRYRYWDFTHEVAFTRSSLSQILRTAGFTTVAFFSAEPVPKYSFKSAIRYCLWKLIELFIRAYLLIETGSAEGIFTQNIIGVAQK